MTPAPTTSRCSGTLPSTNAPVEETMALLVDLDAFEARHVGAGGDDNGFGVGALHLAVGTA